MCVNSTRWPARRCLVYRGMLRCRRARIPTRFVDVDSTINRVYEYGKQGADYGYTRMRGLHPLLATLSTPIAAPAIAGARLRRGSTGSAKGAASFVAEAITTARAAGATGIVLARMDSAFDNYAVVATCIRAGIRFSITTKQTRPVRAAIETINPEGWVPIAYPHAIYDQDSGQWISDAEIAETTYTAFGSRRKSEQVTVRLIVRRVKDKNIVPAQGELFTAWRYHAFITDSTLELVQAEKQHREHGFLVLVLRGDRSAQIEALAASRPGLRLRCHSRLGGLIHEFALVASYE